METLKTNRNSDGQEVMEPGKHANNVYLKDCPFVIGQHQVSWFQQMQSANERHSISSVDDFSRVAKMKD